MAKKKKTEESNLEKPSGKYWPRKVFIPNYGIVSGEATEEQIEAFKKVSNKNPDTFLKDTDLVKEHNEKRKLPKRRP